MKVKHSRSGLAFIELWVTWRSSQAALFLTAFLLGGGEYWRNLKEPSLKQWDNSSDNKALLNMVPSAMVRFSAACQLLWLLRLQIFAWLVFSYQTEQEEERQQAPSKVFFMRTRNLTNLFQRQSSFLETTLFFDG